jgi:phenylacetate-CoA ligase
VIGSALDKLYGDAVVLAFHLHQDLCHVEIVGSGGGNPADAGKGEVIISNLVNRGTVLLNYRLGDLARLSHLGCPCRRTSPLLTDLEGRSEDIITLRDGRMVHPRTVWEVFEREAEVLQYQVIQHDFERFEVRVVTESIDAYRRVSGSICNRLQAVLGAAAAIEPAYYESLPTSESGKFKPVISRCGDAGSR